MKEQDEVTRLLQHPDPAERTMALKMGGLLPEHLEQAAKDDDVGVHTYAINHPDFNHELGIRVLQSGAGTTQKLAVLHRQDLARPEHLAALYQNRHIHDLGEVYSTLVNHPVLDEDLARILHNDPHLGVEHRHALLEHGYTPQDVHREVLDAALKSPGSNLELAKQSLVHGNTSTDQIEKLLRMAVGSNRPDVHEMARHVLQERILPSKVIQHILTSAKLHTDQAHADLRVAAASGPGANEGHLDELVKDGNPLVHQAAVGIPGLKSRHIDTILDRILTSHPRDDSALSALMDHPSWGYQHFHRLLSPALRKGELAKAIDPNEFSPIVGARDIDGERHVDHVPDLTAHPAALDPEVKIYREQILNSPTKVGKMSKKAAGSAEGITRKAIFQTPRPNLVRDSIAALSLPPRTKFMVKPYHERVIQRVKKWMKYPIQGWAEMTHQALYHAAGIGHLHQKVHVSEHNMGRMFEKEPALVIHMSEGYIPVGSRDQPLFEEAKHDTRKIALMDMLSNNHDRHEDNLMVDYYGKKMLAVDHSRSFQYYLSMKGKYGAAAARHANMFGGDNGGNERFPSLDHDDFNSYLKRGIAQADPPERGGSQYDRNLQTVRNYAPVFDWWREVSPKVREAFNQRIAQLKDPDVRDHVRRNFNARADWLDERAHERNGGLENFGTTWHLDPIPHYRPGRLTDEEKAAPEYVEAQQARSDANREAKKEERAKKYKFDKWLKEQPVRGGAGLAAFDSLDEGAKAEYGRAYDEWFGRRPKV